MTFYKKQTFMFGATVFLIAVLIITLTPMMLPKATTGTLLIKLTDAPVDLEELWINITKVEAHSREEGWIELEFVGDQDSVWVDILTLQNVTMNLTITEILPGNYTKLRMQVNNASANFTGAAELTPLTVPPGKIDIIIHFEIKTGKTTELLVDMQADWVAISKSHKLRPVLKATIYTQP